MSLNTVCLDNLCRYNDGCYKGKIDWERSKGCSIRITYDDLIGYIEICDYDKTKQKVKIKFNDTEHWIYTSCLLAHKIGGITKIKKPFKYRIGDIVNGNKVIDRYVQGAKKYKYECQTCKHIGEKTEYYLTHKGCPICSHSSRWVDKNINGLSITHPDIYNLIIDDDADLYSFGSSHKVHWRCPYCHNINYTAINHLTSKSPTGCAYCSDGYSYPEKVLYNVLSYTSKTYEKHKAFIWSDKRIYDAFDNGIFIEIHGEQHYKKAFSCNKRTLEEERENDRYKMELAEKYCNNFIDYITIKAFPADFESIKLNILNSRMSIYYNLSLVDWEKIKRTSATSLIYEVGSCYQNGRSKDWISNKYMISIDTVYSYLHRATELGICNFVPDYDNISKSHQVRCINTGDVFPSESAASRWCLLKSHNGISKCVRKIPGHKTAGRHPITGEPLMWEKVV
jgi:hypothetical protein